MDSVIILACSHKKNHYYYRHVLDDKKEIFIRTILMEDMHYSEALDHFDTDSLDPDEVLVNTIPFDLRNRKNT